MSLPDFVHIYVCVLVDDFILLIHGLKYKYYMVLEVVAKTMTVQLKPPSPFPFHRADEWQKWFEHAVPRSIWSLYRKPTKTN